MRRRGFLASLAGIAVASAVQCFGAIEGPKEAAKKVLAKISEAYQNAQYEEMFYFHPKVVTLLGKQPLFVNSQPPLTGDRYDFVQGEWVKRPNPANL